MEPVVILNFEFEFHENNLNKFASLMKQKKVSHKLEGGQIHQNTEIASEKNHQFALTLEQAVKCPINLKIVISISFLNKNYVPFRSVLKFPYLYMSRLHINMDHISVL